MWTKGQSGNPAGRTKASEYDIAPYARIHGRRAIDVMVECLNDDRWKLPAAIALLDRGYGKPAQEIKSDGNILTLTFQHLIAARSFSNGEITPTLIEGEATNVDTNTNVSTSRNPPNLMEPATE